MRWCKQIRYNRSSFNSLTLFQIKSLHFFLYKNCKFLCYMTFNEKKIISDILDTNAKNKSFTGKACYIIFIWKLYVGIYQMWNCMLNNVLLTIDVSALTQIEFWLNDPVNTYAEIILIWIVFMYSFMQLRLTMLI